MEVVEYLINLNKMQDLIVFFRFRFSGFFVCVVAFAAVLANAAPTSAAVESQGQPFELFKHFLEEPPVIDNMVYVRKLRPDKDKDVPLDVGIEYSTNYQIAHLQWQPSGFFFREIKTITDFASSTFYGETAIINRTGGLIAQKDSVPLMWELPKGLEKTELIQIPSMLRFQLIRHFSALTMGIYHIRPGHLKWRGDEFSAKAEDKDDLVIHGVLKAGVDGFAKEMKVIYQTSSFDPATYIMKYFYSTNVGLSYFPNIIKCAFLYKGKEIPFDEINVQSIRTGAEEAPQLFFEPGPFVQANKLAPSILKDGKLYRYNRLGQLIALSTSTEKLPGAESRAIQSRNAFYFYLMVGLITALIFALMLKSRARQPDPTRLFGQ